MSALCETACVCVHTCMCECMCVCACVRTRACVRVRVDAGMCVSCVCVCACVRVRVHMCVLFKSFLTPDRCPVQAVSSLAPTVEWKEMPPGKRIPESLLFLLKVAEKSSSFCANP